MATVSLSLCRIEVTATKKRNVNTKSNWFTTTHIPSKVYKNQCHCSTIWSETTLERKIVSIIVFVIPCNFVDLYLFFSSVFIISVHGIAIHCPSLKAYQNFFFLIVHRFLSLGIFSLPLSFYSPSLSHSTICLFFEAHKLIFCHCFVFAQSDQGIIPSAAYPLLSTLLFLDLSLSTNVSNLSF